MRKWLLAAYCIPYAYLAIWGDAVHGTMLLYALMAAAFFLLCKGAAKLRSVATVVIGNLISTAASCLCLAEFGPQDMAAYFKPFTAWSLLLVISLAASAMQGFYVWRRRKRQ